MERLARKLAESIGASLGKSEDDVAVVTYGLIGILQVFAIFLLVSSIGFAAACWFEVMIVFLSVGFLRRLSGGAHSSGIYSCLIYSVFFVCTLAALARYALIYLPFLANSGNVAEIFIYGYVMIALKAPVAPPNKPVRTEAKRKRLRKGAFIVLSVFLVLVTASLVVFRFFGEPVLRLYTIGLALALSTLWQVTMLTKLGQRFIAFFDGLFTRKKS